MFRSLGYAFLLALVASCQVGCKKQKNTSSFHGFILGDDDMVSSSASNTSESALIDAAVRATGSIVSRDAQNIVHYCTGVLIPGANGSTTARVLTNAHCFLDELAQQVQLAPWACNATKVFFGLRLDATDQVDIAECKEGTLRIDAAGDVAVFELKANTKGLTSPLRLGEVNPPAGESTFVVHHPTRSQSMTTVAGFDYKVPASMLTKNNCAITATDSNNRGESDNFPYDVGHTCDIIAGSSGAPLVSQVTGEIVAINWGGIEWRGSGETTNENRAIPAAYIQAFLPNKVEDYIKANPPVTSRESSSADSTTTSSSKQKVENSVRAHGCSAGAD